MQYDPDFQMALLLQKQFEVEYNLEHPPNDISYQKSRKASKNNEKSSLNSSKSLTDPSWELVDPTPNIYLLFVQFNEKFFWNKLLAVSVDWSKRMTTCAGICSYQGRSGLCRITLSEPLLKLRPRKDLIETLLHEMIHAYLFVTHNNKDRDGHGPEFHKHMYRINSEAGTHITVYHDFHDEVRLYKQHWWRCDGPCVHRPPYFGMVRRATNRAPGPYDRWWAEHQQRCGGKFIKVKEPEKKQKSKTKQPEKPNKNTQDIRNFIPNSNSPSPLPNKTLNKTNTNTPFGKQGTINKNGTVVLNPKTQTRVDKENVPATISKNNGIVGFKDLSQNNNSFPKKSKDNVPSSGNIIGFKDLVQTSGQSSSVNTFTGSGNTLTNSKMTSTQNQDYSTVRNHWLNKFSNNQTSKTPELKRKSLDINSPVNKKQKSDLTTSSAASNMNPPLSNSKKTNLKAVSSPPKGISCPNCNKSVCEDEINSHLDTCLNADVSIQSEFSSDLNESTKNMVECPVCNTVVEADNLNSHLDECLSGDSEEVIDEKVANKTDEHCNNLKRCEICDKFIDSSRFETHVQECLNSFYDDIETKYDLKNENSCNETVTCLVCNKNIVRADLDNHLEECMVSVFDKDVDLNTEEEEEDMKESIVDLNKSKCYNCPICMAPIDEETMNSHIDLCLNSAAMNENIFN